MPREPGNYSAECGSSGFGGGFDFNNRIASGSNIINDRLKDSDPRVIEFRWWWFDKENGVLHEYVNTITLPPLGPTTMAFTDPARRRGNSSLAKLIIALGLGIGATVAGGGGLVGAGAFAATDMALGVVEYLQGFKGKALTGFDVGSKRFPLRPDENLYDGIFRAIDTTVQNGGTIRFNLTGMNPYSIWDPNNPDYDRVTTREFRYVYT
jgi:hypothetical protein